MPKANEMGDADIVAILFSELTNTLINVAPEQYKKDPGLHTELLQILEDAKKEIESYNADKKD